jgi:hypothetical protein
MQIRWTQNLPRTSSKLTVTPVRAPLLTAGICLLVVGAVFLRNDFSYRQIERVGQNLLIVALMLALAAGFTAWFSVRRRPASLRRVTGWALLVLSLPTVAIALNGRAEWIAQFLLGFAAVAVIGVVLVSKRLVFINVVVFVGLLALVEMVAWTLRKAQPVPLLEVAAIDGSNTPYGILDPVLGTRARPEQRRYRAVRAIGSDTIYDVIYSIGRDGWRNVPQPAPPHSGRFVAFFGCSFTFGEGVEDSGTLPAAFARETPVPSRVYNFGFSAWGPQHALALMESPTISLGVSEQVGDVILPVIDHHTGRVAGDVVTLSWGTDIPHYRRDGSGAIRRDGTLGSKRPVVSTAAFLFGISNAGSLLGVERFAFLAPRSDWGLTADIIGRTCAAADQRWPGSRCSVLVWPGSKEASRELVPRLASLGIRTLDYSAAWKADDGRFTLHPNDHHPNPQAFSEVARRLAADLPPVAH